MYEKHNAKNKLYGEVIEVMENAFIYNREIEKMRSMLQCLLTEHETGNTDKFWRDKMYARYVYTKDNTLGSGEQKTLDEIR